MTTRIKANIEKIKNWIPFKRWISFNLTGTWHWKKSRDDYQEKETAAILQPGVR